MLPSLNYSSSLPGHDKTSHLKPWMGVTYPAQHPHLARESQGKEEVQRQGWEVSPKGLFEKESLRPRWQEGGGTYGGSSLQLVSCVILLKSCGQTQKA